MRAPQEEGETLLCPLCPSPAGPGQPQGLLAGLCFTELWCSGGGRGAGVISQDIGAMEMPRKPLFTSLSYLCHLALAQGTPVHYDFLLSGPSGSPQIRGRQHVSGLAKDLSSTLLVWFVQSEDAA